MLFPRSRSAALPTNQARFDHRQKMPARLLSFPARGIALPFFSRFHVPKLNALFVGPGRRSGSCREKAQIRREAHVVKMGISKVPVLQLLAVTQGKHADPAHGRGVGEAGAVTGQCERGVRIKAQFRGVARPSVERPSSSPRPRVCGGCWQRASHCVGRLRDA